MNILIDIGHPAHVHLFKNLIYYLRAKHHRVIISSRDKDVCNQLLEHYCLDPVSIGMPRSSLVGLAFELLSRDWFLFRLHRRYRFDMALGSSVSIAHLGRACGIPSFAFTEDDDAVVPLFAYTTYPFATGIINPDVLAYRYWRHKRTLYPSYQELAYLHPDNFIPDPAVPEKYGLKSRQYVVMRKSALKAHHDTKAQGISQRLWQKIEEVAQDYAIVESREAEQSRGIKPWDMHSLLACAKLVISDSQTMTAEAAVLGVPAIRYNSFVGRLGYLNELEQTYRLAIGFRPSQEAECVDCVRELLDDPGLEGAWQARRNRMLREKVDFNQWMIQWFEVQAAQQVRSVV